MATKPLRIAIIGSGLGGAVLADLLAGHHDVTVFERGSVSPSRPKPPLMTAHPFGLYPSFAYGLGGTTNFWHGGLVEMLDDEMGAAWPESLKRELPRWYDDVALQLYGGALKAWRARDPVQSSGDLHFAQLFYPPAPFRAAQSGFLSMAELRMDHRVERLEDRDGGVDVVSLFEGKTVTERFDRAVIAAGGLNAPLLLQRSGLGGAQAGRNFTDHPMGFVAKLKATRPSQAFLRLRGKDGLFARSQAVLKTRDAESGLWSAFYLRAGVGAGLASDPYARSFEFLAETTRGGKYRAALPHLRDPDFLWQAVENQLRVPLPSSHAYVLVLNEQEATAQGTVRAAEHDRIAVDWNISEAVDASIRRNLKRLADYTESELILPEGPLRNRLWSAAHHSGTCRISPDEATGVVDEELRVHGTEHILVCDGSVLPSTGTSNTGLTIAALAHRLAARLNKERGAGIAPAKRRRLVKSGATGAVGRMMRARLAERPLDWISVEHDGHSLPASGELKGAVFLHLANAHGSVEENLRLQQRAANFAEKAGIDQIIVPMSTFTLEIPDAHGPRLDAENLGFAYGGHDPYPQGKLAAERFWLDWQAAKPGRRLALVYVPNITGPRSRWTEIDRQTCARHDADRAPHRSLLHGERGKPRRFFSRTRRGTRRGRQAVAFAFADTIARRMHQRGSRRGGRRGEAAAVRLVAPGSRPPPASGAESSPGNENHRRQAAASHNRPQPAARLAELFASLPSPIGIGRGHAKARR
jgi:nucleoside-diphosphate-sugar epimerase